MIRCAAAGLIFFCILSSQALDSLLASGGRCQWPLSLRYGPYLVNPNAGHDIWRAGSSVSCRGSERRDRQCTFRNLCYWPRHDSFILLHGEETTITGLPVDRATPFLDASSVVGHNGLYFDFVDLPASIAAGLDVYVHRGMHLIFKRFNPENLMHVLHDDLLPLFATLSHHCTMTEMGAKPDRTQTEPKISSCHIQLVIADGRPLGEYFEWLTLLYPQQLLTVFDFQSHRLDRLVCFEHAVVGLDKSTTWYQYGFDEGQVQGPIVDSVASGTAIHQFSRYVLSRAGLIPSRPRPLSSLIPTAELKQKNVGDLPDYHQSRKATFTLISRTENRCILNEDDVVRALSITFNASVEILRLEQSSVREILGVIKKTTLLIGMHGSALALAVFLPRGAAVLELFPFAVRPSDFTPYATLANLKGMGLEYRAWVNKNESLTVTHPDYPESLGGIRHLSKEEQEDILKSDYVRPKPCCYHPEWLFRIYQDTTVDIVSLLNVTNKILKATARLQQQLHTGRLQLSILPGQVRNVSCKRAISNNFPVYSISWVPSWNTQYILNAEQELWYEVFVQTPSKSYQAAYKLQATSFSLSIDGVKLREQDGLFVWVRAGIEQLGNGPFGHPVLCNDD